MKRVAFEFRDHARFQPGAHRDAEAVGQRLAELRKQGSGELTPHAVVEDAAVEGSPLHTFFEWDDGQAAREHRLSQARSLIRAVVVVYADENDAQREPVRVVAYSHIEGIGQPHYRDTAEALADQGSRTVVLQRALRELQSWRARYTELSELAKVFSAAEETADQFKKQG